MELKDRTKIRILGKVLFVIYIGFLFYFLLLSDWYGRADVRIEYSYNLELFKEIKRFWEYRNILGTYVVFSNLVGNILIFLPFGFFLPMASKFRSFIAAVSYSFLLSLLIECIQLVTKIGSFDVDDLFLNTLGGAIGYIVFIICCKIRRTYVIKQNKKK